MLAKQGLINKELLDRFAGVEVGPRLAGAANQILGEGAWRPLKTLGGLLMTMPDKEREAITNYVAQYRFCDVITILFRLVYSRRLCGEY